MKIFTIRFIAISITFVIGIFAVWFWVFSSQNNHSKEVVEINKSEFKPKSESKTQQIQYEPVAQIESKKDYKKPIPFNKHENFDDAVLALKRLIPFMDKKGEQTFLVSDVRFDDGEYAYAYWKQDNSIIILHFPFYGEPNESELYWLSGKARIDLKNVVPTGKYENLGCCLVEKDWADKVLSWCKKGYKLKVIGEKQTNTQ
jgi:hypothetical protein